MNFPILEGDTLNVLPMKKVVVGFAVSLFISIINPVFAQLTDQFDTADSLCTTLTYNMLIGSRDSRTNGQVTDLQAYLQTGGYLQVDPTGYFGSATRQAVIQFQTANNISPTGQVGPLTRAKIQQLSCGTTNTTTTTTTTGTTGTLTNTMTTTQQNGQIPTVTSMIPTLNSVTLYGYNFTSGSNVSIEFYQNNSIVRTISGNDLSVASASMITFSIPANLPSGTYTVKVSNSAGRSTQNVSVSVTQQTSTASANPIISSVVPTTVAQGGTITVSGSNFSQLTGGFFDSNAPQITFATKAPAAITFTVPSTLTAGSHTFTLTGPGVGTNPISITVTQGTNTTTASTTTTTSTSRPVPTLNASIASGAAILPTTPFTLSWGGSNNPTSYNIKIDNLVLNGLSASGSTVWSNTVASLGLPNTYGLHTVAIQACNAAGCSDWSWSPFFQFLVTSDAAVASSTAPTTSSVDITGLTNGGVLKNTNFTITWSGNNNPSYYNLKIDTRVIENVTSLSWTGTAASLDLTNSLHTVYVQACNARGCSPWSPSPQATFIVTEDPAVLASSAAPTSSSVDLNTRTIALNSSFTATWTGNNNPTSYDLLFDNSRSLTVTGTTWTGTPASLSLSTGSHTIAARACNARGCSSYSYTVGFNVVADQTGAPTSATISPAEVSVASNTYFTLSWSGNNNPQFYNYRLNGGSPQTVNITSFTNMPSALGLAAGGRYTFEIQACNTSGCGPWSSPAIINVSSGTQTQTQTTTTTSSSGTIAPTSAWISPADQTVGVDQNISLSWGGNNNPVYFNYKLNDGSPITMAAGQTSYSATPRQTGFVAGGRYLFSVSACNTAGCSPYSSPAVINVSGVLGATTMCVDIKTSLLYLERTDANSDGEVSLLQKFLVGQGLLDKVTGYYGRLTRDAVMSYQAKKGIDMTGNVGAMTAAAIKKDTCQ